MITRDLGDDGAGGQDVALQFGHPGREESSPVGAVVVPGVDVEVGLMGCYGTQHPMQVLRVTGPEVDI